MDACDGRLSHDQRRGPDESSRRESIVSLAVLAERFTAHKEAQVFVYGDFQEISPEDPSIFAYGGTSESGERWLAILNFSGTKLEYQLPESLAMEFWACSNCTRERERAKKPLKGSITLEAWEGVLGKCKSR